MHVCMLYYYIHACSIQQQIEVLSYNFIIMVINFMQITAKPKQGQKVVGQPSVVAGPAPVDNISPGVMVACFVPKYRDEIPQIGEVLEVNNESILLHWWDGTYSGHWKALSMRQGRTSAPWTESVSRSSILCELSLTKSLKLSKTTQEKLHKVYEPLLANFE